MPPVPDNTTNASVLPSWDIRVFYDGACPLCLREVRMLRRLDRSRRIDFVDIAAAEYDAAFYDLPYDRAMARIHAVTPAGEMLTGVEVFRRLYAAVGLGWLVAPTRWPLLRGLADRAYELFARHRLRLTGRSESCASGHCVPPSRKGS